MSESYGLQDFQVPQPPPTMEAKQPQRAITWMVVLLILTALATSILGRQQVLPSPYGLAAFLLLGAAIIAGCRWWHQRIVRWNEQHGF